MPAPTADEFYLPGIREQLSQGDIALTPSAVLWSDRTHPPALMGGLPAPPALGDSVVVALWDDYVSEDRPPLTVAQARWGPVIVLSHDCEIDKDFSRRVVELIGRGVPESEALERASDDESLDPLVVVAPVLPLSSIPADQHNGIMEGSRIGYLPIPPGPLLSVDPMAVDLSLVSTVERRLVLRQRVYSLTDEAVGLLRYKLSEFYSSRGLATFAQLQAIVGQEITEIELAAKTKRATSLVMHLGDGQQVHVEIRTPREGVAGFLRIIRPS